MRPRGFAVAWLFGLSMAVAAGGPARGDGPVVVVRAGMHERLETPVRLEFPAGRLGAEPGDGPRSVTLREVPAGASVVGQLDRGAGGAVRLTFLLPGRTPAGAERRFRIDVETIGGASGPWSFDDADAAAVELRHRDRKVFRYNRAPVSHPDYPAIQDRDAYIHPAYTPSGALITGDYSKFHPHHRGFFLAYARTQVGDLKPDFWNIHGGTGKIHFDGLDAAVAGPVTARLTTRHRWQATGVDAPLLRERWEVEVYDVPGTPYWLFDLTSTQQATGAPLELVPYRYGGMAYRGPEPFVKGPLAVLTSAGHADRRDADQKPARWIDLTGPIAEGSSTYGGAVMLDHPSNVHHPTVVRIHPTTLPFFSYVPSHDVAVTIPSDRPAVFRYRVAIHDGKPDGALDERLWRDFAEPPAAAIEAGAAPDGR